MVLKVIFSIIAGSLISAASWGGAISGRTTQPSSWVPYPWAKALPVSWTTLQGVWIVGEQDASSYFYIRVVRERASSGAKYLSIVEKDGQTCETIANGFGTEQEGNQIFAEMTKSGGERYSVKLRQYEPKSLPGVGFQAIKGKVTVLTIMPHSTRNTYNYPMAKVSDRTEYNCVPKK